MSSSGLYIQISALAGSSGGVDEQHESESQFIAILRHACGSNLAMNFKRGGNYVVVNYDFLINCLIIS